MKYFINGYLALSRPPDGPVASYIVPFVQWLGDQGYGLVSMRNQVLMAAGFSKWLGQKGVSRLNMRRAKIMTTALRSFLSYARYRGDITSDLVEAVPIVANWSLSSIPRAIGRDEVTRLLASIDRDTPVGCRDYAMILALARLGLRSSEAVSLELGDIDWATGQIRVRGKNGQRNDLPL